MRLANGFQRAITPLTKAYVPRRPDTYIHYRLLPCHELTTATCTLKIIFPGFTHQTDSTLQAMFKPIVP